MRSSLASHTHLNLLSLFLVLDLDLWANPISLLKEMVIRASQLLASSPCKEVEPTKMYVVRPNLRLFLPDLFDSLAAVI